MSTKRDEFISGWPVVAASFFGIMLGMWVVPAGLLGPLTKPMEADLGWSHASIMTCLSILGIGGTLGVPLVGWLADRINPRPLVLASLALLALLFLLASAIDGALWQLQVIYALIGLLCGGSGGLIYMRVIGQRFKHARGLAMGIALAGSGAAQFTTPLLVHVVNVEAGWRGVFLFFAGLTLLLAMPIAFFGLRGTSRSGASEPGHAAASDSGITRNQALRDPRFWLIASAIGLFGLFMGSLLINLVPMFIDNGLDAGRAALVASTLGIAVIVGRIGIGLLLDRFRPSYVGFFSFALGTVGALLFLILGVDFAVITVVAIGLLLGAEIDLMSFMTVRYFGVAHYGEIYGLLFAFYTGSSIIGPQIGIALIRYGSYTALYSGAATAFAAAALMLLLLSRFEDGPAVAPAVQV